MISQNKFGDFRYCPPSFVDSFGSEGIQLGDWREETQGDNGLLPLRLDSSNNYSRDAKETRDNFRTYFNNDGKSVGN